jgi:hypothetical protein
MPGLGDRRDWTRSGHQECRLSAPMFFPEQRHIESQNRTGYHHECRAENLRQCADRLATDA